MTTMRRLGLACCGVLCILLCGQLSAAEADVAPFRAKETPEQHAALRGALTQLPPPCLHLIALLIQDPPLPYAQISVRLGIPVGSIGPSRRRCLGKLRRHRPSPP